MKSERNGRRAVRGVIAAALGVMAAAGCLIAAANDRGEGAQAPAPAANTTNTANAANEPVLRGDYRSGAPRWWKGNTHAHTWWSEGDAPPEVVAAWYVEHGYNFLVLSDHNMLQQGSIDRGLTGREPGDKWYFPAPTFWYPFHSNFKGLAASLATYRERFGDDWVQMRKQGEKQEVRLRTLDEFRHLFERTDQFMFMQGEEITGAAHVNGINLQGLIEPRGGDNLLEVMQNNLDAVRDQRITSGRRIIAQINHPNYRYSMTIEDLVAVQFGEGEGFFELYNVDDFFNSRGDALHTSMERLWDIVLAKRLADGRAPLFAVATDDAHIFSTLKDDRGQEQAGLGWIMVRAARLTPDSIVAAMQRGDFYATSGVTLRDVSASGDTLRIEVEPQAGTDFTIEFIGTRRGTDLKGTPVSPVPADAVGRLSHRYGDDIGVTFERVKGTSASYRLRGDELYVRARIVSSRTHPKGRFGDKEMAWTQPLVARAAR